MPPRATRSLGRRLALTGLVLLPVVLAAALWFVPRLTDWNEHRDRLAILAAGRLGQPVTLTGPVKLVLLPQPMLEAGGVTIGGPDSGLSVEARALRLRLDWLALLRLRLEPREVTLVGAEIRLPWPPVPGQSFRPPPWLTALQGRIQDSRVMIGQLVLERVDATLAAGAATDALQISGRFRWRQTDVNFETTLGRPGWDGAAPLTLTLSGGKASVSASGVLLPEGGFEGSLQGGGSDLSALLPTPPGSFRLRGRLSVTAELLTADDLVLDIAGIPARGAATLRVAPAPRLDLALATGRVELDPWIAALRRAGPLPLPFGLDLSADAAGFRGLTLRRLRGAAFLAGDRLTLTDVGAVLPGETEIELSGATTSRPAGTGQGVTTGSGERLEATVRFHGAMLRSTLLALGLPLEGTEPDRLREGDGRFKLVLDETQAAVPEFTATLDGSRVSGAGVLRFGARPALGVGLTFERLPLDGWLRPGLEWPAVQGWLAGVDANLRLSAERAQWHDLTIQGLSADASLENGRLTARRLSGQVAGSDVALSGVAQLGPTLQLSDLALEVNAPGAAPLLALLPGDWPDQVPLGAGALALRLSGNGPPGALVLRGSLELGDLRAEASGTLDLPGRRYAGGLTLRHPGAPRLLGEAAGLAAPPWLGEGSFSLVGTLTASPQAVHAESFDLVAAGLRMGGQLDLALDGARPRLSGRIAAERLPLPPFDWNARDPFPLAPLGAFDAELTVTAQRIEPFGLPPLANAAAALRLKEGVLQVENLKALLAGGQLSAGLRLEAGATPPVVEAQGRLTGATLAEPLLGLPVDVKSGQVEAEANLRASGHSPAALLATLGGQAQVTVRNGVLDGTDLRAALAVSEQAPLGEAESSLRQALLGGATAFEALHARLRLQAGHAVLEEGRLVLSEAPEARLAGEFDLARGGMDLRLSLRDGEAPELGLRMTGSATKPRLVPEIADWLRWRAER
ncbi:AsmA family protein [Roseomonas sp. E05]|uniref:AsmA family protein n=1 Tax=Roseomonas sp. E05 TaxID=3046310 RepID=UPI0024BBE5EF|nr:AsmA family protein [Roseomonas sp. E05]MDJ0387417.1 AsmA family protein [Roseomonas sp. E05]